MKTKLIQSISYALAFLLSTQMYLHPYTVYAAPEDETLEDVIGGDAGEITGEEDKPEWDGWDEDSKEDVYTVFANTSWEYMPYLIIANSNSYTKFDDINKKVREDLMDSGIIDEALGKYNFQKGYYPNKEYAELILGIVEEFCKVKGMYEDDDIDVGFNYIYSSPPLSVDTSDPDAVRQARIDSVDRLFTRLILCEYEHRTTFESPADIYNSDEKLASVLQGIVYGSDYVSSHETSTKDTAKEYYKENKDSLLAVYENVNGLEGFGSDIISRYSAVKMIGSIQNFDEE